MSNLATQQLFSDQLSSNAKTLSENKSLDEQLLNILAIDPDRYFEEVVTLFVPLVLAFLRSKIKEPKYVSEIEDFVQQAFTNFRARMQNLDEKPFQEMNHLAYLHQSAWNVFLKRVKQDKGNENTILRTVKSFPSLSMQELEDSVGYELACQEWGYGYIELMTDVKEQIAALSNKECRNVMVLHLFSDLSNHEIAKKLGLPLGTVKSHISRGKKILRKFLEHSL